jgi:hypothetical protein
VRAVVAEFMDPIDGTWRELVLETRLPVLRVPIPQRWNIYAPSDAPRIDEPARIRVAEYEPRGEWNGKVRYVRVR